MLRQCQHRHFWWTRHWSRESSSPPPELPGPGGPDGGPDGGHDVGTKALTQEVCGSAKRSSRLEPVSPEDSFAVEDADGLPTAQL